MARTAAAAALTEEHRVAQGRISASALRDFLTLWPIWQGDAASFASLIQATQPLVTVYRQAATATAGAYYEAFRSADEVAGTPTVRLADPVPAAQLGRSMLVTGQSATRLAVGGGQSAEQARKTSLVRVSGAVTRQVVNGARDTILGSVQADPEALGWTRVTDGAPCAFCAMLASRGAVYKSEAGADFQAHDHCGCQAAPLYPGFKLSPQVAEYRALYNKAVRDARAAGELDRGTTNDSLNAFRRALEAQRH